MSQGVSYENLTCSGTTTVVQIDGSSSMDDLPGLLFSWTTDCPNGLFDDPNSTTPVLTFDSVAGGGSTMCSVMLSVSDDSEQSSVCQAAISVQSCTFDCRGTLNGPAREDACGVCEGNNECFNCEDVETFSTSFALDNAAVSLFKTLRKSVVLHRKIVNDRTYGKDLIATGSGLYASAWSLAWGLPSTIVTCDNVELCQAVDNQAFDVQFQSASQGLKSLIYEALSGIGQLATNKQKAKIKKYKKRANKLTKRNDGLLQSIPDQSQCVS